MIETAIPAMLSDYGDALEATFAPPSTPRFEVLANQSTLSAALAEEIDPLDDVVLAPEEPATRRPLLVLAGAASVAMIVLAAFGIWASTQSSKPVDTTDGAETKSLPVLQVPIFPGETVLRTEPLVVIAAPAQDINFDTTKLGTEVVFGEITDLSDDELEDEIEAAIDTATRPFIPNVEFSVRKVTLLWHDHGRVFGKAVSDGVISEDSPSDDPMSVFGPAGSTIRYSSTFDGSGGGGGADDVDGPNDLSSFRIPETVKQHVAVVGNQGEYPIIDSASVGAEGFTLDYEVAQEVAVVQMIVEDTSVWMRPIAGKVTLTGSGNGDTRIELVTFNADGEELTRRQATVGNG